MPSGNETPKTTAPVKPLVTADTPPDKTRLVGQNYTTPDLVAKVTGKTKYAEDYRADGMLFAKLLLSPYPLARIVHLDGTEALAMPGVKGMLTMDDLPAPADSVTDLGAVIKANMLGERGLAMEPVFQGEPILAVAAVDELTAAEAIEKIKVKYEPLPFVVDAFASLRPGGPNARTQGNTWMRQPAPCFDSGSPRGSPSIERSVSQVDRRGFQRLRAGQNAHGPADRLVDLWRSGRRLQESGFGSG